jgi:hypothetical protein
MSRLLELREEQERREREILKVYRPSIQQGPIHRSKASEIIVRGGKRAGKSVAVSALFASRVTGTPVIAEDGTEIHSPWSPPTPDYPRIYWIIGWDTKHIGQTIFRLLFLPGQGGSYRVIQDEKTGQWRAWNRANPEDRKRISDSKLAEPLIPERMLDGGFENAFEWEDKKANQFNSVRLKNGAVIYAYPSSARNPKQGDAVSGIWIDEDIQFPNHLKEWQDRLTDEEGWFVWSVWPHMKNEALLELINRAEMAERDENPQIESFQLVMTDNPFLSDKGKKQSLGRMESDEEIARRNRGELLIDALSMYQFSPTIHQIQRPMDGALNLTDLSDAHRFLRDLWLAMNGFPKSWTRYLSIDPSNTRTACHSWVIPPREVDGVLIGNLAIAEWELVARRFSADMLAKSLMDRSSGYRYEAFIMDQMAGRQTHAGRDDNTFEVYASAFKRVKFYSRLSSYSFIPGCNVKSTRYRAVRDLMRIQPDAGIPSLLFVEETNQETKREFARYRKKSENRGEGVDSVLDEPMNPRLYDCMASVEYFSAYIDQMFLVDQAYVDPSVYGGKSSPVYQRAQKMLKKRQEGDENVVYMGVGQ